MPVHRMERRAASQARNKRSGGIVDGCTGEVDPAPGIIISDQDERG